LTAAAAPPLGHTARPGFNCVGFSQGNSLCRGYIQKYNDPPVITFISVHGTVSGVAGFPHCNPAGLLGPVCKTLANLGGDVACVPPLRWPCHVRFRTLRCVAVVHRHRGRHD